MADFEKRWSELELFSLASGIKGTINHCKGALNDHKAKADSVTAADKARLGLTQEQWDALVQLKSDMGQVLELIEVTLGY